MRLTTLWLVFSAVAAAQGTRYEARWDPQTSGVKDTLHSVCFIDTMQGWAAGDANVILKTTDGGKTWKSLQERQQGGTQFRTVTFVNANEGWALSSRVLLHSTDGGESWQPARNLPGNLPGFGGGSTLGSARYQMHEPTAGAGVYRTTDGGVTWQALPKAPPSNAYSAIFFVDPQHGWVSGDYGRFAFTEDGGKSWVVAEPAKADFQKVQFVNPQRGWLLPQRGHTGGLLASTDGGRTWTSQYAGVATSVPLMDMQFLNENDGVLLSEAAVLETANGGKNWKTLGKMARYPRGLSFPKLDEGWVVGTNGSIVHYHLAPVAAK